MPVGVICRSDCRTPDQLDGMCFPPQVSIAICIRRTANEDHLQLFYGFLRLICGVPEISGSWTAPWSHV
jgi:hypothetical protein